MLIPLCSFRHSHRARMLRRRLLRRVALVHQVRPWGAQERRLPCTHQALFNKLAADSEMPDELTHAVSCCYTPGPLNSRHPFADGRGCKAVCMLSKHYHLPPKSSDAACRRPMSSESDALLR